MGVNSDAAGGRRSASLKRLQAPGEPGPRLAEIAKVRDKMTSDAAGVLQRMAVSQDEDPIVRAAAITALAGSGRTVDLEARPPVAVRSAALKAAAIGKRRRLVLAAERGESEIRLPRASPLPAESFGAPIETGKLPTKELRRVVAVSFLPTAGAGTVQALHCMGNELALITRNDDLDVERLTRAPARPAQIAVHHTLEEDVWTVPYDVVTVPRRGGQIRVSVLDQRGDPRFTGSAQGRGEELVFKIHAAERPGATPVTLIGRVSGGKVFIDTARAGPRGVAPRHPTRS